MSIELRRKELRLAAQQFGAVANDRKHRRDVSELAKKVEDAARALVEAEQTARRAS